MNTVPELIFVYNADSTLAAAAGDFVTRIFAPQNYSCDLCMVTYGPLTMRSPWKEFLDTVPNKKTFLHRDEFKKQYPRFAGEPLPAVFTARGGALQTLITAEEIHGVKDWRDLKALLLSSLLHHAAA